MSKKGLKVPEEVASRALNAVVSGEYTSENKINIVVRAIAKMGYYDLLFEYGLKHKENELAF